MDDLSNPERQNEPLTSSSAHTPEESDNPYNTSDSAKKLVHFLMKFVFAIGHRYPSTTYRRLINAVQEWIIRRSPHLRKTFISQGQIRRQFKAIERRQRRKAFPTERTCGCLRVGIDYRYTPLQSHSSIRCLYLEPGQDESPIVGSLIEVSLDDEVRFKAISYVWGDKKPTAALSCIDGKLPLSGTVHRMLHRLRDTEDRRLLWIDAICINQQCDKEKTSQVKIMGQIYRNAARVIVWLGDETEDTKEAFDMMQMLSDEALIAQLIDTTPTFEGMLTKGLPDGKEPGWQALGRVLGNSRWFTRIWVLQELKLAQSPYVQSGDRIANWRTLSSSFLAIARTGTIEAFNGSSGDLLPAVNMAFFDSLETSSAELLDLLYKARWKEATKPRDKVFALIGLAKDKGSFTGLIDYDNHTSNQSIYTGVAETYLLRNDLRVLNLAGESVYNMVPNLPSWVPDWSRDIEKQSLAFLNRPYRAGGPARAPPNILSTRGVLVLCGKVVDQVVAVGRHAPRSAEIPQALLISGYIGHWKRIIRNIEKYPTGELMKSAFARTITLDCYDMGMLSAYQSQAEHDISKYQPRVWEDHNQIDNFRYRAQLRGTTSRHSFFLSAKDYIGMGPMWLRPGDIVVIFCGGPTPYIIRKAGKGRFKLVGEAFMHGLMYGEALSMEGDLQDFSLV